jgi:hypothetical protein
MAKHQNSGQDRKRSRRDRGVKPQRPESERERERRDEEEDVAAERDESY